MENKYSLLFHPKQATSSSSNNNFNTQFFGNNFLKEEGDVNVARAYSPSPSPSPSLGKQEAHVGPATGEEEAIAGGGGKKKVSEQKKKKARRQRYAFQTRSQVDILNDGYRWRKYGQKAVKNNNFPRSYYRCTYEGCNVKKQVQRLSKDEGIVVTTYEGMHTHPINKSNDNFEHILNQMQINYSAF